MQINNKLRILLANQGWTQKYLADLIYVSPDAVSSWIRGINHPDLETIKLLCEIFYVPIEEMTNDNLEIPEYFVIDQKLPYPMCCYPEKYQDSIHLIIDADLANEGKLHRFRNPSGVECSAIYYGDQEIWWHYREHEARMIRDWNMEYSHD